MTNPRADNNECYAVYCKLYCAYLTLTMQIYL